MSMLDGTELEQHIPKITEEQKLQWANWICARVETSSLAMNETLAETIVEVIDIIVNGGFIDLDEYNSYIKQMEYNENVEDQP